MNPLTILSMVFSNEAVPLTSVATWINEPLPIAFTPVSTSIDEVSLSSPLTDGPASPIAHPVARREGGCFVSAQPVVNVLDLALVDLTADVSED